MFQQHGRLDIAGRRSFYRVLATVVGFDRSVLLTKNLFVGAAVSFVASLVVMIALVIPPTKKMALALLTLSKLQTTGYRSFCLLVHFC